MKFCLIKIDPDRYPNLPATWYREFTDLQELHDHCGNYAGSYFRTTFSDPHFESALAKGDAIACARHPMNLMPKRTVAMTRALFREGTVYVGKMGGWMTALPNTQIIQMIESDKWPTDENTSRQYVKIGKWPLGNHYYLRSWPSPLPFSAQKYNTYEEAHAEALRFVTADRIEAIEMDKVPFVYPKDGD